MWEWSGRISYGAGYHAARQHRMDSIDEKFSTTPLDYDHLYYELDSDRDC